MNSDMWMHICEFKYKNSLTGHFLVHPKSYVFFMKSYMNSWYSINSYMNFDMNSLPGHFMVTRILSLSWNHARYIMDYGLLSWERSYWKSCLKNTVKNIVKNIVNWWKIWVNWTEFFIEFMRRCADAPYLTGPGHSAAAAPEPSASQSAGLFGRATVLIPATLVLSDSQFLLQARLASHQLESQRLRCNLSADSSE